MRLVFQPLKAEHALAIISWRYSPPYHVYNFDTNLSSNGIQKYLLDPKNSFWAILSSPQKLENPLEGFCSFGKDGQVPGGNYTVEALDIGMGVRPDLTGNGQGTTFAKAVVNHGISHYKATSLRVTIAAFNQRAQRVWHQVRFEQTAQFKNPHTQTKFVVMSLFTEYSGT